MSIQRIETMNSGDISIEDIDIKQAVAEICYSPVDFQWDNILDIAYDIRDHIWGETPFIILRSYSYECYYILTENEAVKIYNLLSEECKKNNKKLAVWNRHLK